MKKIVMIHTIQKTISSVGERIKTELEKVFPGQLKVYHMLDERFGEVDREQSPHEKQRERLDKLRYMVKAAELSKPDVILVACSTLSPQVRLLGRETKVPLVAIDGRALEYCGECKKKITVFATSANPVEPVLAGFRELADRKGIFLQTETVLWEKALPYLLKTDELRYREEVLQGARELRGKELVYLAQGSTGILQKEIEEIAGCEVVSSVPFCVEELKELLQRGGEALHV